MALPNYGSGFLPRIVRTFDGREGEERSTMKFPGKSSQAYYLGQFVTMVVGTDAAPQGSQYYISPYSAYKVIYGYVKNFTRKNSTLAIWDDTARQGTITDATSSAPPKYTFAAGNDENAGSSAILEMVEVMPICQGDVLEVTLWGAGSAAVVRGTTTAAGSDGSSDNMGVGLPVNTSNPWALTEASANKLLASTDFITTSLDGNKPSNAYHVFVSPIRASTGYYVPIA